VRADWRRPAARALCRVHLSRPDLELYGLTHQADAFGAQFAGAGLCVHRGLLSGGAILAAARSVRHAKITGAFA